MNQPVRPCLLHQPGRLPYAVAWEWQLRLCHQRRLDAEMPDALILLEHWPVYTLGQGADLQFVKFDINDTAVEVYRVERGGEVTYHCPGQLVGYPILNLRFYRQDLHWYLRQLEEVVIQTLAFYGLKGERIPGLTGVWVDGYKVAAMGIKVSRWITMHGFAINVCPDLSGFRVIVPCGIADKPVGSLQQFLPGISVEQVQRDLISVFANVFNVTYVIESDARSLG